MVSLEKPSMNTVMSGDVGVTENIYRLAVRNQILTVRTGQELTAKVREESV